MRVKFGDVVVRANTKEDRFNTDKLYYVGGEHIETGEYLVTKRGLIAGSNIGPMFYFGFRKGQVLLASRSPDLKKAGMVTFDGICSEKTFVIETRDENVLLQSFLPIIVRSEAFWEYANNNQSGSVNHFINWSTFSAYEFDLPSLEEQRELSEIVWAMVDAQRAYKALIAASDELVKSQFIEMFGDPIENPHDWTKLALQEFVSEDCSISYGIVKTGDDVDGGVPVFRPVDIVDHIPRLSELKRTAPEISAQYKRTLLTGRELLITVRANIGDTCIIGEEFKGCNVGRGIVPIRTKEGIMRLEFLKCQMDNESMAKYIYSLAKGITLIQLNMEDLRKIRFITPPLAMQDKYILFVRQLDKSKFVAQKATRLLHCML